MKHVLKKLKIEPNQILGGNQLKSLKGGTHCEYILASEVDLSDPNQQAAVNIYCQLLPTTPPVYYCCP